MSPQNSTLGLIGGDFQYSTVRSGFKSGMYRPEDNAYIRNYAEMVDNFFYTGNVFTYSGSNAPNYLSGIFIDQSLTRLFSCGGYTVDNSLVPSTDNSVYLNLFSEEGRVLSLGTSSKRTLPWITGTFNNTISWWPNQSGLSFKPDGTKLIMSGNLVSTTTFTTVDRGPIIIQYSLSTPWDIQTITGSSIWNYDGTNYSIYTTSSQFWDAPEKSYNFGFTSGNTTKIQDIFVHPDGLVFYYLRNNILYQGSISSAWDIGTSGANLNINTASLSIDSNLVSSSALTSPFSGFTFNATGTKLYLISGTEYSVSSQSRSGAVIFQYNLSTPWSISTASFKTFLTVTGFDAEMVGRAQGLLMLPDGETMICASLEGFIGRLYEYKVLPY